MALKANAGPDISGNDVLTAFTSMWNHFQRNRLSLNVYSNQSLPTVQFESVSWPGSMFWLILKKLMLGLAARNLSANAVVRLIELYHVRWEELCETWVDL
jgi:hypothetical protein